MQLRRCALFIKRGLEAEKVAEKLGVDLDQVSQLVEVEQWEV